LSKKGLVVKIKYLYQNDEGFMFLKLPGVVHRVGVHNEIPPKSLLIKHLSAALIFL
jgi:hypothetical protein